ncbi:MAG: SURF1 family protein [Pseudomonadota bacterium]
MTPLFCGLGIWQLDRAEQKRSTAASLEMRRKLPALPITHDLPAAGQLEFRKVTAAGRYLSEKTVLIENRKHQGKTGFHVITPLQLADTGQIVLVNRGWMPRPKRDELPSIPNPQAELIIEGEVSIPHPPALELSLKLEPTDATPHWPFLTLEHYSAWSGLEILPFLILQAPGDSNEFIRRWPQPQANDAMHIGYAIQWFAFALIALVIWLRLSLHKQASSGAK